MTAPSLEIAGSPVGLVQLPYFVAEMPGAQLQPPLSIDHRLIRMLKTGVVAPDDPVVADTTAGEDEVLESVLKQDWAELYQLEEKPLSLPELKIGRRRGFRWIDPLRGMFPKGDL